MKPVLIAASSLALGSILGWLGHALLRDPLEAGAGKGKTLLTGPAGPLKSGGLIENPKTPAEVVGTSKIAHSAEFLEQGIKAAAEANAALGVADFADKLAGLLTGDVSLEDRVEAEGMKRLLNPERFGAFYAAYARRTNLHDSDNTLNPILVTMGQQFGRQALDAMLVAHPDGFERMDSLLHGWGMGDPEGAVQWFNDFPETHPRYEKVLQGLVWGLAAKDGTMAGKVMVTLSDSDQKKAMYGFASSFVGSHGLEAFDAWARTAPEDLAPKAIAQACHFATFRPPAEYVPWFAGHISTLGLRGELRQGFGQWFASEPKVALDWLMDLPDEKVAVQSVLSQTLPAEAVSRFLLQNPNHPAGSLLEKKP